jgi:MFS family permease
MFVQGEISLYIIRILLGAFEAGFFPGVILYLTYWFPDRVRAGITGLFFFGAPLSFIFGGPASGLLLGLDGALGLYGYQWMFLIEGLAATLVGIWAYFYLDDRPEHAKWLPAEEKAALIDAIQLEQTAKVSHGPSGMLSAMMNPTVLFFSLIFFLIQMGVSVALFYLPEQIARLLGTKVGLAVGLVIAIPWSCALISTYFVPKLAERHKRLRLYGAASLAAAALGMLLSGTAPPLLALALLCIAVAGLWGAQPIFWTLLTTYLGGAAAVTGIALVNTIANIGNFVSPNVKAWADKTFESDVAGLMLLSGFVVLAAICFLFAGRERTPAVTSSAAVR